MGHVALQRLRRPTSLLHFARQTLGRLLAAAVDERDLGPVSRQSLHDRAPDAPAAAGHHRHLILESHGRSFILARPARPARR